MFPSLKNCAAASVLFVTMFVSARAQTPAPNTTEWESEALKLRLFYPSDLAKADVEQIMHDGNLALAGVSGTTDQKLAEATRCLRPLLVLQLPESGPSQTANSQVTASGGPQITVAPSVTATILLAELDLNCLNAEHASRSTTLLNNMAEIVNKVPGMKPTAQPATYTIGWQKVQMAAAQGQPQAKPQRETAAPSQLFTMGISTNWNNHLLVWYFTSNSIDTLNRITKTTVRFGRNQAAPLYPLTIGNATP
ncbi:MAG TPA: hypothetical protein VHW70_10500 [Edaphobacter sp.]|jgi:hypothetical protein|nr:hypothetical protein [Edaphobacter sp.]